MFSTRERSKEMTSIRQLTRASALALVALAVAAPLAQAMPAPRSAQAGNPSQTARAPYPYAGQEFRTKTAIGSTTVSRPLLAGSPAVTPVVTPVAATASGGSGFDWGNALIAAVVAAVALVIVGLAGLRVRARGFAH
jgi:hypothetical protein